VLYSKDHYQHMYHWYGLFISQSFHIGGSFCSCHFNGVQMNYIREINNFRVFTGAVKLQSSTQGLWSYLMHINNICGWIEWFKISNARLMDELCMSEKTLIKHRNILCEHGLIIYKSQKKKKNPGEYKLVSINIIIEKLELNNTGKIPVDEEVTENNTGKIPVEEEATENNTGKIPVDEEVTENNTGKIPVDEEATGSNTGKIPVDEEATENNTGKIPVDEEATGSNTGKIPVDEEATGSNTGKIPVDEETTGNNTGKIPVGTGDTGKIPDIYKRSSSSYINTTTTKDNITFKKVVEFFNQNFHSITPHEMNLIKSWLNEFSEEIILKALVVSVEAGKRSIQYFEGVLKNWLKNNLKTVEAIETHQKNFSIKRITPAKGQTTQNKFHNFDQREKYSNDELERKLGIKC